VDFDDLMRNPGRYGFCTFREFRKNKAKWKLPIEQLFISVLEGGQQFKNKIKKMKFMIQAPDGILVECRALEDVQRRARDFGYALSELNISPVWDELGGDKANLIVRFYRKIPS